MLAGPGLGLLKSLNLTLGSGKMVVAQLFFKKCISKCNLEYSFGNCIFIDVSFSILLLDDLHKMQSEIVALS